MLGWETQVQQIANSINNLPIGLKHKTPCLENLDLITPNRLLLGRNNERCPNAPLRICADYKGIILQNADIFRAWFKTWMIDYVPLVVDRPKWHRTDSEINIGDVVLFLKAESKLKDQYQYGMINKVHRSSDNRIRKVEVLYRNSNETCDRITQRGVRDLVIVHPVDELDIYEQIAQFDV